MDREIDLSVSDSSSDTVSLPRSSRNPAVSGRKTMPGLGQTLSVADAEFDFSFPDEPMDAEISDSRSPEAYAFIDGTAPSSPAATRTKSTVADAEFDFSFLDDPPDPEISGLRLSQLPIFLEGKTWSSLTAVILLHAILVCFLSLSPRPHAVSPKSIQVQLVSMMGGSEPRQRSPEAGKDEQPGAPASPVAALPVKKEPPDSNLSPKTVDAHPKQHPDKIAKVTPRPKQRETVNAVQQSPQTEPHSNQSESSVQSVGTGAGSAAEAGAGSGTASSGQAGSGGVNGVRGSGPSEIAFGSPNGPNFLTKVMPAYPVLARRLEKEGTVLLRVTIDERGCPVEIEVLRKAGFGFDEEAVKAVKDSTFTPAKLAGKPLACKALLPIRFVLKSS